MATKAKVPTVVEPEIQMPDSWKGVYDDVVEAILYDKVKLSGDIQLSPQTKLSDHLDSLDLVELTMEAEDRYGLNGIPDDDFASMKNLGDFVDYICRWRLIPGDRSEACAQEKVPTS